MLVVNQGTMPNSVEDAGRCEALRARRARPVKATGPAVRWDNGIRAARPANAVGAMSMKAARGLTGTSCWPTDGEIADRTHEPPLAERFAALLCAQPSRSVSDSAMGPTPGTSTVAPG